MRSWQIAFEFVMLNDSCVFQSSELLALTRGDISGAIIAIISVSIIIFHQSELPISSICHHSHYVPGIVAASKKEQDAALTPISTESQISKSGFIFGTFLLQYQRPSCQIHHVLKQAADQVL